MGKTNAFFHTGPDGIVATLQETIIVIHEIASFSLKELWPTASVFLSGFTTYVCKWLDRAFSAGEVEENGEERNHDDDE